MTDVYGLSSASEAKRESDETSSRKTRSLPLSAYSMTALCRGSGIFRIETGFLFVAPLRM